MTDQHDFGFTHLPCIYADVAVTRRQRLHHVMTDRNVVRFSSGQFGACLRWLYDQGHTRFVIDAADREWLINITDVHANDDEKTD